MTIQIGPVQGTFEGAGLLDGLRQINESIAKQTEALSALSSKLGDVGNKTDDAAKKDKDAAKAKEGLGDKAVQLNAALEVGKKAFEAVAFVVGTTIKAIQNAAEHSRVLQSQFDATSNASDELEKAFARQAERSGALHGIFDTLQRGLEDFASWVGTPQGGQSINTFFTVLANGAGAAVITLGAVVHSINKIRETWELLTDGFSTAAITETGEEDTLAMRLFDFGQNMFRAGDQGVLSNPPPKKKTRGGGQSAKPDVEHFAVTEQTLQSSSAILAPFDAELAGQASFVDGMASLFQQEQEARREHAAITEQLTMDHAHAVSEANVEQLNEQRSFFDKLFDLSINAMERQQQVQAIIESSLQNLALTAINGFTGMVAGVVDALVSGTDDILGALGNLLGGFMRMMGQAMLAEAATLYLLAIPTYGATIPQAVGLTAGGIALIALGAILSGSAGGGGASVPAPSAPPQPSRATGGRATGGPASSGFFGDSAMPAAGGGNVTVIVNLGRGFMTGTPRELGRHLRNFLRDEESLRNAVRS